MALLPDAIEPWGEIRRMMGQRQSLYLEGGGAARAEITGVNQRIAGLTDQSSAEFPLNAAGFIRFMENLASQIMEVHDIELTAVQELQAVMTAA